MDGETLERELRRRHPDWMASVHYSPRLQRLEIHTLQGERLEVIFGGGEPSLQTAVSAAEQALAASDTCPERT